MGGAVKLYDISVVDMRHYAFAQTHGMYDMKSDPYVNFRLLALMCVSVGTLIVAKVSLWGEC